MTSIAELVEHEVMSWPNVEKLPHRFGGIEFRVNGHEIGHLHGNRQAVLANARTRVVFQCSQDDATVLGREFGPVATATDLRSLDRHRAAIRLCVDGSTRPAFVGLSFIQQFNVQGFAPSSFFYQRVVRESLLSKFVLMIKAQKRFSSR